MMKKPQKTVLFTCLLLLFALNICAQKNHFIYIQSEGKQPFYVKFTDHLFGSSDAGYLIIPKLTEGTYSLSISFPGNEWQHQNVTCIIKEADAGYLLKNFGDKGWGLINLQTMVVMMAKEEAVSNADLSYEMATDSFSLVLASVVNDPGILKRQKNLKDTQSVAANENKLPGKPPVVEEAKGSLEAKKKEPALAPKAAIVKLKQESIPGGVNITFLDVSNTETDTVLIFISVADAAVDEVKKIKPELLKTEPKKDTLQPGDSRFLDIELPNPNQGKDTAFVLTDTIVGREKKAVSQNKPCAKTATNNDFLALRKQMAAALKESDMINVALKKFRSTCFSTGQIKDLGGLFLSDEGKYKLYVAAYPFVSDLPEFNSLESQLKDEYYIVRFKAMVSQ